MSASDGSSLGRPLRKLWRVVDDSLEHHVFSERRMIAHLFFWAGLVHRKRRPFVIGITGSVGKSTTSEIVGAVVEHPEARRLLGPVGRTTGNMNHHPGVPMTVLGYRRVCETRSERARLMLTLPFRALRLLWSREFPRLFVLEFGSDRSGYLKPMVDLIPPDIGIVTAVGAAHLDGMGSLEGVAREKSTVVAAVAESGLAILGEGHEFVDWVASQCRAPVVRCGGRGVELAQNIARVIGQRLGIPDRVVEEGLASATPPERRLRRFELRGLTVIDDSYNANPLSMSLGLDTLTSIAQETGRRRLAVLGAMAELGPDSQRFHVEIGQLARQRADVIIAVGEKAKSYDADHWFPDSAACAEAIEALTQPNDVVLVKGSASVEMAKVAERLRQRFGEPEHP